MLYGLKTGFHCVPHPCFGAWLPTKHKYMNTERSSIQTAVMSSGLWSVCQSNLPLFSDGVEHLQPQAATGEFELNHFGHGAPGSEETGTGPTQDGAPGSSRFYLGWGAEQCSNVEPSCGVTEWRESVLTLVVENCVEMSLVEYANYVYIICGLQSVRIKRAQGS